MQRGRTPISKIIVNYQSLDPVRQGGRIKSDRDLFTRNLEYYRQKCDFAKATGKTVFKARVRCAAYTTLIEFINKLFYEKGKNILKLS